jgi:hypothetical protein
VSSGTFSQFVDPIKPMIWPERRSPTPHLSHPSRGTEHPSHPSNGTLQRIQFSLHPEQMIK